MTNEADTRRKFVVPKLQSAGRDNELHSITEQRSITDDRVISVSKGFVRYGLIPSYPSPPITNQSWPLQATRGDCQ
jgi:hypothetical protein